MANLAIKGHATRGKEVIEILEMLGGKNNTRRCGGLTSSIYFINENGYIDSCDSTYPLDYLQFTLEEFLQKYPYKVVDKVMTDDGDITNVVGMIWDNDINDVFYEIQICNEIFKYPKELLQPYKEETMKETNKTVFEGNAHCCDIMNDIIKDNIEERKYAELRMPLDDDDKLSTEVTIDGNKIFPPNNYLIGKVTQVDNGMLVEFVKKQPQYPKTLGECCKVLSWNGGATVIGYDAEIIENFQKLKLCRDAYWKISGEQMGLGKPWEPDWTDNYQKKWTINFYQGEINLTNGPNVHFFLAFPTRKMRDAFYENFKDLIEKCKELL